MGRNDLFFILHKISKLKYMKRIISCCDGTWNRPNSNDDGKAVRTNVQKIFNYIAKYGIKNGQRIEQIKNYDEGVGAEGNTFTRMFNGATGKGLDENILQAYKFVSWNYEEGDEIFLFGFSRGAYTARSLAGLIRKCGIIVKNDLNVFDQAYALYRDTTLRPDSPKIVEFRKQNSYEPQIKFIGVWDTVGSMGLPLNFLQWYNKKKYQFYDTKLSSLIDYAYHAISIDERRKTFAPTLWQKSDNLKNRNTEQVLEQRWFAGVHSNIGGGYPDEGLADVTLKWMIEKASHVDVGLGFEQELIKSDVKPNYKGTLCNSRSGFFSFLPSFTREINEKDSLIDETVQKRMDEMEGYKPVNARD